MGMRKPLHADRVISFFLDEPTAFAAGHRLCFECRRKDAETFAEKWREARRLRRPPYATEMDDVLHAERLRGRAKRLHRRNIDELPEGAFAAFDGAAFAVRGDTLLRWTPEGYHARKPRPRRIVLPESHTDAERELSTGIALS
jgi:hypothetical protein